MAHTELVIKIPEEIYENINNHSGMAYAVEDYLYEVEWAIKNGTPLPKGHGDLIDANVLKNSIGGPFVNTVKRWINLQPIIIEADKGNEE